jgi:DNA-binding transcriptional MerR regulator
MNEISKKELLEQTGISYGQLYRWKREGLIPEDWFEKRSAFTGQETFFPRARTLERVKTIQSMKDEFSLQEIKERLEGGYSPPNWQAALLQAARVPTTMLRKLDAIPEDTALSADALAALVVIYEELQANKVDEDQVCILMNDALAAFASTMQYPANILLLQDGQSHHFLAQSMSGGFVANMKLELLKTELVADALERLRSQNPEVFLGKKDDGKEES